jgi:hypothetical protein
MIVPDSYVCECSYKFYVFSVVYNFFCTEIPDWVFSFPIFPYSELLHVNENILAYSSFDIFWSVGIWSSPFWFCKIR